MPEQSLTHRPILIVGANGSGTTLLRLMLDSHEHIAIPHETGFLRLAATHRWVPYWNLGNQWAPSLDLDEDTLWRQVAEFYGGLFSSYAERRGKQRWGDKTAFHIWHLELAARMFPEVQIVGIVRHPAAVATSVRRRFRRPISKSARRWRKSTKVLVQQAIDFGERFAVVRYEDLVTAPEPTMRALLDWLGEPWSDAVLAHHEVKRTAVEVEGFTRTDAPIDTSRIDEWTNYLRGAELKQLAARTAPLARLMGYDPMQPDPAEPWEVEGRPLLTGVDLQARLRDRGGDIDWSKRPRPPVADRPLRPPAPPRRRKRAGAAGRVDLDDVTMLDVLRHRVLSLAHRKLPDDTRRQANDLRRKNPGIDRIIGPR
jgi:hypothetical protein